MIKTAFVGTPTRTITLQPKQRKDKTLPYPFFVDAKNLKVRRQDFWKGSPFQLLGFNPKNKTGIMKGTLTSDMFMNNPQLAVGMYPIMEHSDGSVNTYSDPIEKVTLTAK